MKTKLHTIRCIDKNCGWSMKSHKQTDGLHCKVCGTPVERVDNK